MAATTAGLRTAIQIETTPGGRRATLPWALLLPLLTVVMLAIGGYHPLSEDGGLYVAGIECRLDPTLFPHYTAFVTEHLRFSVFAPMMAALVKLTQLPLAWALLFGYIFSL